MRCNVRALAFFWFHVDARRSYEVRRAYARYQKDAQFLPRLNWRAVDRVTIARNSLNACTWRVHFQIPPQHCLAEDIYLDDNEEAQLAVMREKSEDKIDTYPVGWTRAS